MTLDVKYEETFLYIFYNAVVIHCQVHLRPKNTMAWSYRKNARHRNSKKKDVRKAVCNKTKRKTKNEMVG